MCQERTPEMGAEKRELIELFLTMWAGPQMGREPLRLEVVSLVAVKGDPVLGAGTARLVHRRNREEAGRFRTENRIARYPGSSRRTVWIARERRGPTEFTETRSSWAIWRYFFPS